MVVCVWEGSCEKRALETSLKKEWPRIEEGEGDGGALSAVLVWGVGVGVATSSSEDVIVEGERGEAVF